jgi:Reverse transcriptase (RNA-dependent DNA polymerase)
MEVEMHVLKSNNTWVLVSPDTAANVVGSKWVFRTKYRADGSIERYKARLVTQGFIQEFGIDYTETFSPVIKATTVRLVLSIAVASNWSIRQLDINNAFLHGDLMETVFMQQPPRFVDSAFPTHACKLNKALYGLKQSPRAWFQKLQSALVSLGFHPSSADTSLFVYSRASTLAYMLVYVDDLILTGNNSSFLASVIQALHLQFSVKDLGSLNFFLRIEVTRTATGLHLSQSVTSILQRANMAQSKPSATPMAFGPNLSKFDGVKFHDPGLYRSLVGAIHYVTLTHPDLAFAVNKCCQLMHCPSTAHWAALKRILRYLAGTHSFGLHLHAASAMQLVAFSYADWVGCPDDRRSTIGYAVFLGSNIISWSSKKQPTVAKSSTEAEYQSLAMAAAELLWLKFLLLDLHISVPSPILYCDNLGATYLAANSVFHSRTKHVELDYHFVREKIATGLLRVSFVSSSDQLADSLTKSLPKDHFLWLCDKLMVVTSPIRLRWAVIDKALDDSIAMQPEKR